MRMTVYENVGVAYTVSVLQPLPGHGIGREDWKLREGDEARNSRSG